MYDLGSEKHIQKIIDIYNKDPLLSFGEIAEKHEIDYHGLIEKLKLARESINLKVFKIKKHPNQYSTPLSPYLVDYYYIADCDLPILAEVFGYSCAGNVYRAIKSNRYYFGKNKNMFSENKGIPPFPSVTKRMKDRETNRKNLVIK